MALNERQKAFADYYIQTGNATEAAIKAGYSEKTARFIGSENLTKPDISAYIKERLDEQSQKRVADANEVIEFYTAVMRGEVKDQFGLDASLSDRLKAGDALMKRYNAINNVSSSEQEKQANLLKAIQEAVKNGN
ncbi:MAG: terminase small subunit [Oscillospiraceae bacterium]|nr:terminase small subunit [Oscillospiraceae bacterium]